MGKLLVPVTRKVRVAVVLKSLGRIWLELVLIVGSEAASRGASWIVLQLHELVEHRDAVNVFGVNAKHHGYGQSYFHL